MFSLLAYWDSTKAVLYFSFSCFVCWVNSSFYFYNWVASYSFSYLSWRLLRCMASARHSKKFTRYWRQRRSPLRRYFSESARSYLS